MSNEQDPGHSSQTLIDAYYADPVTRSARVRKMFNGAAPHYDAANRIFSLGSGALYRRLCLRWAGLRPGMQVLDIAVGTGLLTRQMIALLRDEQAIIGLDVSESMLAIAATKSRIRLVQAAAEALPLADSSIDFVALGYALRHIADMPRALREALRVLRPGGTIVLLEISAPRKKLARAFAALYIGGLVPLLSFITTRDPQARALMRYHWETIVSYMPPEEVMTAIADAGFTNIRRWSELDLFHCFAATAPQISK